jgi:hypothetical protein
VQHLVGDLAPPHDDAVGGVDLETPALEVHQVHEDEVVGLVAAGVAVADAALVAVGEGRLVAVVAVGDEDALAGHRLLDGGDRAGVGHGPEPVGGAVAVAHLHRRITRDVREQGVPRGGGGIVVEPEDGREVRRGRAHQLQTAGLGGGVRLFVGAHPALGVVRQADGREEARPAALGAVGADVVLDVPPHGRPLVRAQDALLAPLVQEPPGPAGRVGQHQVDGRVLAGRGIPLAVGGRDHVVRRDDDVVEADPGGVVAERPEGAQGLTRGGLRCHPRDTRGRRRGSDPVRKCDGIATAAVRGLTPVPGR